MAHITTALSISDAAAVSRFFVPRKLSMESSLFQYARMAGDSKEKLITFSVAWSDSTPKRPTVRQSLETVYPIIRNIDGVDTVVDTARAVTTFVIPDSMTEAEANDLNAYHIGGVGHAVIKAGRTTREPIWG